METGERHRPRRRQRHGEGTGPALSRTCRASPGSFFIGGYQPAQKWLKDRKGRELAYEDIRHYQKIIKILSETDRIMRTIEMDLSATE